MFFPHHLHIFAVIVVILALIGAWFVYKSYQEHKLAENLTVVLEDYKKAVNSIVKDNQDKQKVSEAFKTIEQVLKKYQH